MKQKFKIILSASAVCVLAFTAPAQTTQHKGHLSDTAKASHLTGMAVKNYQNEKLGKVADLAVDVESGRIVQVIVATGGFFSGGDARVAVPPGALHHDVEHKILHLDASRAKLAEAPKFDTAKWEEGTRFERVTEVYGYYGEKPYFIDQRSTNAPEKRIINLPRNMDGTINSTAGERPRDQFLNAQRAREVETTNNTISTRNPDGTWTREYYANGEVMNRSVERLGYVQKASKLIGTPVRNWQDEKLGKVENLIVDLPSGRIVAVIISSGGFIGMGDELSAVPPTALRFNAEHDTLELNASREMLASAPHFKANQWPNFGHATYVGGVYRAYKVEPYFDTAATSEVDNSRQNVRDRHNQTLTPLDQGNSEADRNTTAQIRKEIIADDDMSMNAKNVKIITRDGRVTLRGPVNTENEKRTIGEIADRVANAANVDNQLEVKPMTTSSND